MGNEADFFLASCDSKLAMRPRRRMDFPTLIRWSAIRSVPDDRVLVTKPCGTVRNGVDHLSVEGAPSLNTGHSVARYCTLNAEKSRLRVRQTTVQGTQWHSAAPSILYPTD